MSKKDREEIKRLFKGYRHVTTVMIRKLESYGLRVLVGKNHAKIIGQHNNLVIIAKSPSDIRSGKNAASEVIKLILAERTLS